VEDLARLATDPSREARAAFMAGLQVLAAAVGCAVVPLQAPLLDITQAHAGLARSVGELSATVTEATADRVVSDGEARAIETCVAEADRFLEALRAGVRPGGCR
jgi:hypothetical protein